MNTVQKINRTIHLLDSGLVDHSEYREIFKACYIAMLQNSGYAESSPGAIRNMAREATSQVILHLYDEQLFEDYFLNAVSVNDIPDGNQ